jgi:gluconolactonase
VRGLKVRGLTNFTQARDTACMDTSRRSFLTTLGTVAAAPLLAREYGAGAAPIRYPEPDVIALDEERLTKIKVGIASIEKLHTGLRWAEGPAWTGAGQYLGGAIFRMTSNSAGCPMTGS